MHFGHGVDVDTGFEDDSDDISVSVFCCDMQRSPIIGQSNFLFGCVRQDLLYLGCVGDIDRLAKLLGVYVERAALGSLGVFRAQNYAVGGEWLELRWLDARNVAHIFIRDQSMQAFVVARAHYGYKEKGRFGALSADRPNSSSIGLLAHQGLPSSVLARDQGHAHLPLLHV